MPDDPLEMEQKQIAEDAKFVQNPTLSTNRSKPTISASSTTMTRSSREIVLFSLVDGPTSPEEIGNNEDISTDQASSALNDLHNRGLIELLVPENDSQGPIFSLTVRGDKAVHYIDYQASS